MKKLFILVLLSILWYVVYIQFPFKSDIEIISPKVEIPIEILEDTFPWSPVFIDDSNDQKYKSTYGLTDFTSIVHGKIATFKDINNGWLDFTYFSVWEVMNPESEISLIDAISAWNTYHDVDINAIHLMLSSNSKSFPLICIWENGPEYALEGWEWSLDMVNTGKEIRLELNFSDIVDVTGCSIATSIRVIDEYGGKEVLNNLN